MILSSPYDWDVSNTILMSEKFALAAIGGQAGIVGVSAPAVRFRFLILLIRANFWNPRYCTVTVIWRGVSAERIREIKETSCIWHKVEHLNYTVKVDRTIEVGE